MELICFVLVIICVFFVIFCVMSKLLGIFIWNNIFEKYLVVLVVFVMSKIGCFVL